MTRILLLGIDPETVDFSDNALPPGVTVEKVRADIEVALKQFTDSDSRFWSLIQGASIECLDPAE